MCTGLSEWRLCGCLLDLYLLPAVCIIGLVLNSLCLVVFKSHTQHPLVPALMVLSFCDLLQLFFSLFVLFLPALHDYSEAPVFGALGQVAFISTGFLSPLLLASNCASIWTMCYITIQRHRAITKPLMQMQSPPRPFAPLFIIVVTALFFNALKWLEFEWHWIDTEVDLNETIPDALPKFLLHRPSPLTKNQFYIKMFDFALYPVLVYIIPLLLLTVLNFRILSSISIHRVSFDHKSRLAQERRSVTLLISIVLFFFFCHTGGIAFRFMDLRQYEESEWFVVVKDLINVLFNFNSMCNPMLYFLFTRQFRDLRSNFLSKSFAVNSSRYASLGNVTRSSEIVARKESAQPLVPGQPARSQPSFAPTVDMGSQDSLLCALQRRTPPLLHQEEMTLPPERFSLRQVWSPTLDRFSHPRVL